MASYRQAILYLSTACIVRIDLDLTVFLFHGDNHYRCAPSYSLALADVVPPLSICLSVSASADRAVKVLMKRRIASATSSGLSWTI